MPVNDGMKQKLLDAVQEALDNGEIEEMISHLLRDEPVAFIVFKEDMKYLPKVIEVLKKHEIASKLRSTLIKALELIWDHARPLRDIEMQIIAEALDIGQKDRQDKEASANHWLAKCY